MVECYSIKVTMHVAQNVHELSENVLCQRLVESFVRMLEVVEKFASTGELLDDLAVDCLGVRFMVGELSSFVELDDVLVLDSRENAVISFDFVLKIGVSLTGQFEVLHHPSPLAFVGLCIRLRLMLPSVPDISGRGLVTKFVRRRSWLLAFLEFLLLAD